MVVRRCKKNMVYCKAEGAAWLGATRQPECYFDGASLLDAARKQPPFDLAFLDIYLPGESGIAIAEALQSLSPETGIAFVSTSEAHAVQAFSLHALHYLVKPVTNEGIVENPIPSPRPMN